MARGFTEVNQVFHRGCLGDSSRNAGRDPSLFHGGTGTCVRPGTDDSRVDFGAPAQFGDGPGDPSRDSDLCEFVYESGRPVGERTVRFLLSAFAISRLLPDPHQRGRISVAGSAGTGTAGG